MDWPLETDFNALFPERKPLYSNHFGNLNLRGQRVLITGAAGSIGSALARKILRDTPERLVLLDHSEQAIYDFQREFPPSARDGATRFIFGDIRDDQLLENLLENEKPGVIFHAAAFKHVPLLENNPFAAIENNGLATWELARKAAAHGVPRLLLVSTDKAANPQSMLGISKRLAELAILRWNSERTRMSAVRLGNVAGSSGSVLPIFREQILRGGPVEVTHRDATRYFLTIDEACAVIGAIASAQNRSGVFVPEMDKPVLILAIAERMIRAARPNSHPIAVKFTGLRPGDKLHEDLLSLGESLGEEVAPGIREVKMRAIPAERMDETFRGIEEITVRRDVLALLKILQEIAPEFQPGSALMKLSAPAAMGAGDD